MRVISVNKTIFTKLLKCFDLKVGLYFVFIITLSIVNSSCKQEPTYKGPQIGDYPLTQATKTYHFAIHPLHNPAKLVEEYQPLMNYLSERIEGITFKTEASRDYGRFEEKYKSRKDEFILPNPWQTIQAMDNGYNVIAMAGESKDFKGIFIVRKDGIINKPINLKGSAVSYPSPTALAACIMPQYFLHTSGINVSKDIENKYVGSQESSIMNVYLKKSTVGATWPPPWRSFQKDHPKEASALEVIWETKSLINNSVMVRDNVPNKIKDQVSILLNGLHTSKQGREILVGMETARFYIATNKSYDTVKNYIKRFEREVRKIEIE